MIDNYDLWERHDAEQNRWLKRLPKCSICGDPIQQDMAFHHNGTWICDGCISENQKEVNMYE
jgi:formylmethanofuran dehydrogenase subunit E